MTPTIDDVLPIVQCGDPVLRRPAYPVDVADLATPEMRRLIIQMKATMEAAPGVGLAAPQIGVPLQLAVLQDGPDGWGRTTDAERAVREREVLPFTVLVNPIWEPVSAEEVRFYEGCLSVPGLTGMVPRYRSVRVQGLDEHGEPLERVFTGWPARIAQHELDHLMGHLYLDRVETRSLSTTDNYARFWVGKSSTAVAEELGFPKDDSPHRTYQI